MNENTNKNASCVIIALLSLALVAVIMLSMALMGFMFYRYSMIAKSNNEVIDLLDQFTRTSDAGASAHEMQRRFTYGLLSPSTEMYRGFEEAWKETYDILAHIADNTVIEENRREAKELLFILQRIEVEKREFIEQGNAINERRLACNTLFSTVQEKLESVTNELELTIRDNDDGSAIDLMGLNLLIDEARGLFYPVLQCQDVFALSSDINVQTQFKPLLFERMAELKTAFEKIRNHPHLPPEFTGKIDDLIANHAEWEAALVDYIIAVDGQRAMQEPIFDNIREVVVGISEMEERIQYLIFHAAETR